MAPKLVVSASMSVSVDASVFQLSVVAIANVDDGDAGAMPAITDGAPGMQHSAVAGVNVQQHIHVSSIVQGDAGAVPAITDGAPLVSPAAIPGMQHNAFAGVNVQQHVHVSSIVHVGSSYGAAAEHVSVATTVLAASGAARATDDESDTGDDGGSSMATTLEFGYPDQRAPTATIDNDVAAPGRALPVQGVTTQVPMLFFVLSNLELLTCLTNTQLFRTLSHRAVRCSYVLC